MSRHAITLLQATLGKRPERLDAVDVRLGGGKLMLSMFNAKMLGVADVNEPVVTRPSVRVNDGLQRDAPADSAPQRLLAAVRHDFGIDAPPAFEDAEDNGLAPASSFAAHPVRAEVALSIPTSPRSMKTSRSQASSRRRRIFRKTAFVDRGEIPVKAALCSRR